MSVIGIGVDLVECARIQHSLDRFGEKFLRRVFTEGEIEYSMSMKFPARHLAARFAAKEAVYKCQFAVTGAYVGFRGVHIELGAGTFSATLTAPVRSLPAGFSFAGEWRRANDEVFTAVWLRAGHLDFAASAR